MTIQASAALRIARIFRAFAWTGWLDDGFGIERHFQHLIHVLNRDNFQVGTHTPRDIDQIFQVAFRHDDDFQPGAVGSQHFFAHAANRQHASAQGDFASHGNMSVNGTTRQRGKDGGGQGNARAGTVFGDSTFGHVDVDVHALEDIGVNAKCFGARFKIRQRRLT